MATEVHDPEGEDAALYTPEPTSLNAIDRLLDNLKSAWLSAFLSEMKTLLAKDTFDKEAPYHGEKIIPMKVIYKTKIKSDGRVEKLKARIAVRGDLDPGSEGEDNYAPLASFRLLKVLLAQAAKHKCRIYQIDFIGAYLHAKMDRVVFVQLPAAWAKHFPEYAQWFGVPL